MDHHREHDDRDVRDIEDLHDDRTPADREREEVKAEMEARGESLDDWSPEDDRHYREEYERSTDRLADVEYDRVRPAYQFGHRAADRPEWRGRSFEDIEGELQKEWDQRNEARSADWRRARPYVSSAYTRRLAARWAGPSAAGGLHQLRSDQL